MLPQATTPALNDVPTAPTKSSTNHRRGISAFEMHLMGTYHRTEENSGSSGIAVRSDIELGPSSRESLLDRTARPRRVREW